MKARIFIDSEGNVSYVYKDILKDLPLGEKKIERASNVEPSPDNQSWVAARPNGEVIAVDASRDETIRKEVDFLENEMRNSLETQGTT